MGKIIRRPDFAGGGLTAAERAAMAEHAQLWIARAMRTDPIKPDLIVPAIEGLYAAAGLPRPRVVIVPSPRVMAFAGGFAAAIWHLRKHGRFAAYAYDATRVATDNATRVATRDATYAATRDATSAATEAATDDAQLFVRLAHDLLGRHASFGLSCAAQWQRMYQGGNMWSSWECYLTAARDILGLRLPVHEKYAAWEQAAIHGGFRIMHPEFCMVSDFPERLLVDEENRPHCADGPSHRWRDGWSLYYWHGVRVTRQIIEQPETITVEQIEAEQNAEVRRVMLERYGWARYIRDCGARVVDEVGEDHEIIGLRGARLLRKDLPGEPEPIVYLEMRNSTAEPDGSYRRYLERIDPKMYNGDAAKSCHAAMASRWMYRDDDGQLRHTFSDWRHYRPAFES